MTTTETTTNPSVFITDYASYNNGTQFEFGHWIDLTKFNDAQELGEYITKHLKECDKKSPLDNYGSKREEPMFTDFEGFPKEYYSESGMNFDLIYKYIELDFESLTDEEKLSQWNEYCNENDYNELYSFDEDFFNTFFYNNPMEAARAATFGKVNWSDDYIMFDGAGNLESVRTTNDVINEAALIEWLLK